TLFLEAGYPGVERRMRDLIGLAGRIVGLSALFLVFLVPVLTRLCLRPLTKVAEAARVGLLPAESIFPAELQAIHQRLKDDAALMSQLSGEQSDAVQAARAHVERVEFESDQLQARLTEAVKEGRRGHRAKEAFVANMSHEVRTPLHSILGTTNLLMETELDAEQHALADRAVRSSKALLSLVVDIMELTKFDSRSIELESAPFDAGDLLEDVAALSADLAAAKGLSVTTYVDPGVPGRLLGDEGRIRQALMRLMDNAIKFTDAGEVTLQVATSTNADDLPVTVFKISDTGLGIADRERARLFQAFEQLDKSDTRKHGGVGLGLALVARIAQAAGGEVRLQSRQGAGSTFTLALPLGLAPGKEGEVCLPAADRYQGVRVMLVESDPNGAALLARKLEESGAKVRVEHSAYGAFETLLQEKRDVVLIDPRVSGSEALFDAIGRDASRVEAGVGLITFPSTTNSQLHPAFRGARASARRPLSRAGLFELVDRALGRELQEEGPGKPAEPTSLITTDIRSRLRILLVEDNQANQQLVQYLLGRRGYNVDIASNGMIAVEAATRVRYDAILMDCQMPEMDGYEATRRIRTVERMDRRRTPILAMTASILEGDRDRCLEAGMDDTIGKPFQPKEMMAWLERWLLASSRTRQVEDDEHFEPPAAEVISAPSVTDIFGAAGGLAPDDAEAKDESEAKAEAKDEAEAQDEGGLEAASGDQAGDEWEGGTLSPELPAGADKEIKVSSPASEAQAPVTSESVEVNEVNEVGHAAAAGALNFGAVADVIDVSILEPLFEDDDGRDLALELVGSFLEMAPELFREMEGALEGNDFEACARIAHRFVSTSGTVGAVHLARLLKQVEQQAKAGSREDTASLLVTCHEQIGLAGDALRTAVSGQEPPVA
ncbi:MAG: response regulator, partial [Planctomycetota bacterium]|nr:response regulator [Planctomycetota bacterium]